nr:MAG TPA: hypothetical protein [Caudoviricetes sp.]
MPLKPLSHNVYTPNIQFFKRTPLKCNMEKLI